MRNDIKSWLNDNSDDQTLQEFVDILKEIILTSSDDEVFLFFVLSILFGRVKIFLYY